MYVMNVVDNLWEYMNLYYCYKILLSVKKIKILIKFEVNIISVIM